MTLTDQSPDTGRYTRNDGFVDYVRKRSASSGDRARLRRALRNTKQVTDGAWWLLGTWLPADRDEALIMTHVAGWCATHHETASFKWRSLAGEIAAAGEQVSEEAARIAIEGITAEGVPVGIRLERANRVIEMLPKPVHIDWARLISDLVAFMGGGERSHATRHRWYRDYHRLPTELDPDTDPNQTQGDTSDD